MKPYLIDVPVAMIFFNRSDTLEKVFEAVKKARPSELFLIQDGAREGNGKDKENIEKCRKVVADIDWECEVHRDYSDVNLGCGKRVSSGITNAFTYVDRLIIIEDDIVPAQAMFTFCQKMLEKYKNDDRINMISGMNHLGVYEECPYDYFFCTTGAIWGWATWKRVWDTYDYEMKYLHNDYEMKCVDKSFYPEFMHKHLRVYRDAKIKELKTKGRLSSWTYQFSMIRRLQSQLVIVPKYNLMSNIGLTDESTHAVSSLKKIPKGLQRVFFMKTYEKDLGDNSPEYMVSDAVYDRQLWNIMGYSPAKALFRRIESIVRRVIFK